MLYRGGEDKVFEIDNERHAYMELSPEAMAKTKAKWMRVLLRYDSR